MASEPFELCAGYRLRKGSSLDRALLVKTMQQTYRELHLGQSVAHLAHTVDQYLSQDSSLWWVEPWPPLSGPDDSKPLWTQLNQVKHPVGCLWLGEAIDQIDGDRHTYVFLVYVAPDHRRRGIGSALISHAETLARRKGDRKVSLQVFSKNVPALTLYQHFGYQTQSVWMTKYL